MEIFFLIIGIIILGFIVRAIGGDDSVKPKPKGGSEWVGQLLLSLIIGAIVWAALPKECSSNRNRDYDPYDNQRIGRD